MSTVKSFTSTTLASWTKKNQCFWKATKFEHVLYQLPNGFESGSKAKRITPSKIISIPVWAAKLAHHSFSIEIHLYYPTWTPNWRCPFLKMTEFVYAMLTTETKEERVHHHPNEAPEYAVQLGRENELKKGGFKEPSSSPIYRLKDKKVRKKSQTKKNHGRTRHGWAKIPGQDTVESRTHQPILPEGDKEQQRTQRDGGRSRRRRSCAAEVAGDAAAEEGEEENNVVGVELRKVMVRGVGRDMIGEGAAEADINDRRETSDSCRSFPSLGRDWFGLLSSVLVEKFRVIFLLLAIEIDIVFHVAAFFDSTWRTCAARISLNEPCSRLLDH